MTAKLTKREKQVAELIAWGASKKEVAQHLYISVRTVENHVRHIFEKTACQSATELSAWWFCTHYNISTHLSPLARTVVTFALIATYFVGSFNPDTDQFRRPSSRTVRTASTRTRTRRSEENTYTFNNKTA